MKKMSLNFIVIFLFLAMLCPNLARAEFNPGNIITDLELQDFDSMPLSEIQNFLQRKSSRLAYYYAVDTDGGMRTGAEVIWRAAIQNRINPRVLLTLIQKEQSLVENPNPTQYNLDWATGYARCDDYSICSPDAVSEHKGFAKQVSDAASWFRWYLDNNGGGLKKAGITYNIDGQNITPANLATASLYSYTPHWHGNFNFWTIYQRWFSKYYPTGSLLKLDNDNTAWLLKDDVIRPIKSLSVLFSQFQHLSKNVITIKPTDLAKYEVGAEIKFPDYTLIRSPKGTIYLIVGEKRRGIVSMDAFRAAGFNLRDVINVNFEDINIYTEGEPITTQTLYPVGSLLQDNKTGGVYFVENSIKYPVWARELLRSKFITKKITPVSAEILAKLETKEPVKFDDGTLVKSASDPKVYVISGGERRPIVSEKVFNEMGWKWQNIISTNEKIINLHPLGEPIESQENMETGIALAGN